MSAAEPAPLDRQVTDAGPYAPARRGDGRRFPRCLPAVAVPLGIAAVFALGPILWPIDPRLQDLPARLQGPSLAHPLGVDQLGRDLLARVLHGGRLSLGVSLLVTAINVLIGTAVGSLAASVGGAIDRLLTRLIDMLLALPTFLLGLSVAALAGGDIAGVVLALSLFSWGSSASAARSEALRVRALPFIEAARSVGIGPLRLFLRHILPSAASSLIVLTVTRFGYALFTVAGLSFLGVGVRPPTPEWGAMLSEAVPFIERAPHTMLAPGLVVTLTFLLVTLAADSLRRALAPAGR